MSNSLDPDQVRRFVGPDLAPNCLLSLSADDTIRQRVNRASSSFHSFLNRTKFNLQIHTAMTAPKLPQNEQRERILTGVSHRYGQ